MIAPDAFSRAMQLAAALELAEVPYAVGGALALGIWGVPRGTVDVDINTFVEVDEADRVLRVLASCGIDVDAERARREAGDHGMIVGTWDGMRIDVFFPSIDFSYEALKTRSRHEVEGQSAYYLSAESVAVFKLLFFRSKDIADLERLVAVAELDVDYVRRWLVEMMGHDDERVLKWDEIAAMFGHSTP